MRFLLVLLVFATYNSEANFSNADNLRNLNWQTFKAKYKKSYNNDTEEVNR